MGSDLLKGIRQMLHQPSTAEDDVLPVRSKELFMEGIRSESKILFDRCVPRTSVFWPPVDQNTVHIDHQCLDRQGSLFPRERRDALPRFFRLEALHLLLCLELELRAQVILLGGFERALDFRQGDG